MVEGYWMILWGAGDFNIDSLGHQQAAEFVREHRRGFGEHYGLINIDDSECSVPSSPGDLSAIPGPADYLLGIPHEHGFGFGNIGQPPGKVLYGVLAPAWIADFLLILPALWVTRRLRNLWRMRANRCINCDYDLRATPDRCPECGKSRQKNYLAM